ncbi:MAG: hypothetical protein ACLRYB_17225 [Segatella copri]
MEKQVQEEFAKVRKEAELKKAKKELKKDEAMQLEAVKHKNEKLARQASLLHKCMVYIRNQSRHLLAMVEVPDLRDLEQRMSEALKNMTNSLLNSKKTSIFAAK